jgi:hypothetical protein
MEYKLKFPELVTAMLKALDDQEKRDKETIPTDAN